MAGKYLLVTLGCKVNQYESQQIRQHLDSIGLQPAEPGETADLAVVNTCAVTREALRKSRQAIRRASRDGNTPVLVVGCGSRADPHGLRRLPGVIAAVSYDDDWSKLHEFLGHAGGPKPVLAVGGAGRTDGATEERPGAGGNEVWMMPDARPQGASAPASRTNSPLNVIARRGSVKTGPPLTERIRSFAGHQRAFLKVQDGCDAACSYCLVPQLRPALRSKPINVAVEEASDLVRSGHREIVLTGVFLGAYGRDTAVRRRWRPGRTSPLAALVDAVAQVEGLARLRLSSLEPGDVDCSLLDVLARREACVPHLHLPLQSGSATILRRMNRQYTPEEFNATIDRARSSFGRPAISTDIIVGFPGETESDFEATLSIARQAEFCRIHAFPFSPRSGTAAARRIREFTPRDVVHDRLRRLRELARSLSYSFRQRLLGEAERIIVEHRPATQSGSREDPAYCVGRADRYFDIEVSGTGLQAGDLVPVRVIRVTPTRTVGTRMREAGDDRSI
jgi:threonylcarbamoyladenosine tRNA methylthiotransferase MtaB